MSRIRAIGFGFRDAKVVASAVELGVFSALALRPLDLASLTARVGISQRCARDFFDCLVALGILERTPDGLYANTHESGTYLDSKQPTYIGDELIHAGQRLYPKWHGLTNVLRSGAPDDGVDQADFYASLYATPAAHEAFAKGMTGGSLPVARQVAAHPLWAEVEQVVDIGCAEGGLLVELARAHPRLKGLGFDLPRGQNLFEAYVARFALSDRLSFHAGDFLASPLPSADVLVMSRVLHNWDLPTKRMLLAKAHRAVGEAGRLIIIERLIDDDRRVGREGLLASLNMMIMTPGGFDFTAADCAGWVREAGFCEVEVTPLIAGFSLILATRQSAKGARRPVT